MTLINKTKNVRLLLKIQLIYSESWRYETSFYSTKREHFVGLKETQCIIYSHQHPIPMCL